MQLLVDFVYTFRNFVNVYQQKKKRFRLHVCFTLSQDQSVDKVKLLTFWPQKV